VAAFAVENAFEANYEASRGQTVALVNIGAQVVNINIIASGVPCFTRDITTAGNQYTEEIQKALSISFAEAERIKLGGRRTDSQDVVPQEVEQAVQSVTETVIGRSAGRSISMARPARQPDREGLPRGGASKVSGFAKAFHERTGLAVAALNPSSG